MTEILLQNMGMFWVIESYRGLLSYEFPRTADRSSLPAVGVSVAEDQPCAVQQPSNPTERAGEGKKHSVRKLDLFVLNPKVATLPPATLHLILLLLLLVSRR